LTEPAASPDGPVSRGRYERERRARQEAEALLEAKSRELFEANENLERLVAARTAKLRDALQAAETASAMRSRFLAVMSHEIRTPLGGLMGMLDLLRDEDLPESTHDLLEAALVSAEALRRIVDDVLDLTRLDAGKLHFESEPVDLRALVRGVFSLLEPKARERGLSLVADIAIEVPERFSGDATRLRQVISNLSDNAVKFADRGTVSLTAKVAGSAEAPLLRVDLCDEGPGIRPDDQALLFADFSQLEASLSKRQGGVGLGLSICRRIVEGVNGRIGVISEPGQGACFWFEIPLIPAGNGNGQSSRRRQVDRAVLEALSGRHILVAEDNPINRKLVLAYLQKLGVSADVAVDGQQAVTMAAARRYDAILMDIAMPERDGISATIEIRRGDGASRQSPILALTAHVMGSVREQAREAGMVEMLAKPISFEELGNALAHWAGGMAADGAPRGPAETISGEAAVDRATLSDLRDVLGDDDVKRLVREFATDVANRIAVLEEAVKRGDGKAIAAEAHSIRGAAALIGARAIHETAMLLEEGADLLSRRDLAAAVRDLRAALRELKDPEHFLAAAVDTPPASS
jgi:signal transduction histidine kinase/HPt (histidine-containing phosphotransfer) domain-containing protein/ActR/RegA family two-component response regulator